MADYHPLKKIEVAFVWIEISSTLPIEVSFFAIVGIMKLTQIIDNDINNTV